MKKNPRSPEVTAAVMSEADTINGLFDYIPHASINDVLDLVANQNSQELLESIKVEVATQAHAVNGLIDYVKHNKPLTHQSALTVAKSPNPIEFLKIMVGAGIKPRVIDGGTDRYAKIATFADRSTVRDDYKDSGISIVSGSVSNGELPLSSNY